MNKRSGLWMGTKSIRPSYKKTRRIAVTNINARIRTAVVVVSMLICNSASVIAQNRSNQIGFINHLTSSGYHEESLYENQRIRSQSLTSNQIDSLNYLAGWSSYYLKKLVESSSYLNTVSPESPFYAKSHLFSAYNQIHIGNYHTADSILNNFAPQNQTEVDFRNFMKAGLSLLQNNASGYSEYRNLLPVDYYGFSREVVSMDLLFQEKASFKGKSPWLAGGMSAILPGSGKIYAGKTGQGIMSFMITTGLGLVAWENQRKRGTDHAATILFGSAFTIFYAGNIYGSMFSAKIANDETIQLHNQKVLFNLHIPLRNIFDQRR